MSLPRLGRRLLTIRGWSSVFLAAGTALAAVAHADVRTAQSFGAKPDRADDVRAALGQVLVRIDGDRIFVSEHGGPFVEMPNLGTAAVADLKALLGTSSKPTAVDVGRRVVADGASGYHDTSKDKPNNDPKNQK